MFVMSHARPPLLAIPPEIDREMTPHGEHFLGCTYFNRQRGTTQYLAEDMFDEEIWDNIAQSIEENEMIAPIALSPAVASKYQVFFSY